MRIPELQEYAKEHGFDSLRFAYKDLRGLPRNGKWIDAYLGFFRVDGLRDNEMVTVKKWRDTAGDSIEFFVLEDNETIPQEWKGTADDNPSLIEAVKQMCL